MVATKTPAALSAPREVASKTRLARDITFLGLIATALCGMIGVGINIIPFMVQRSQPGIGAAVPLAYLVAAVPAALAALCYAVLSSAMPRAGGSYVYATRALHPLAGFLGSFAQWFGLTMGMGVVAYLMVPMFRDILATAGWRAEALVFDRPSVRVPLALAAIWIFWWINIRGVKTFQRTVIAMSAAMIAGPIIMTIAGAINSPDDFQRALAATGIPPPPAADLPSFGTAVFLGTCVILFSSFIGFDTIAQAGGEARNASDLPKAIVSSMAAVTLYYIIFTWSVYHTVPWEHIYRVSLVSDVSAPALIAPLLPPWLGVIILITVASAIADSIPSVMLASSRLLYAFSADGVFPESLGRVHPEYRTPHNAITLTAIAGSLSVIGCYVARDFFSGVHLLLLSMLLNFFMMALAILCFPYVNPQLHRQITFLPSRAAQVAVAIGSMLLLGALLIIQIVLEIRAPVAWYMKSTTVWLFVMGCGALVFTAYWRQLKRAGGNPRMDIFGALPPE